MSDWNHSPEKDAPAKNPAEILPPQQPEFPGDAPPIKDPVVDPSLPAWSSRDGRVLPPLILYLLGVPGGLCILLWLLFWRH